ncbi:MAG: glycoside hydrolase family 3 C-terminal domain-containing protein [Candidatus Binatia bacterium]|nr:glycoside hydrolase family 3 C-terminal domain-containing protein [Candidatus Binatia bacterium]
MRQQYSWILPVLTLACAALAAGCGDDGEPAGGKGGLRRFDAQVEAVLRQMTLEEKAGQMTQAEIDKLASLDDIPAFALGSLLNGGDADPPDGNSVQAWARMYDEAQRAALRSRLRIPLLYGVDAVHGHSNVVGAVIFPHNIGLGCTRNEELVEEIAHVTAREMRATGLHWTFAPTVAVARDERWGRTYESFSEDPELVARLGAAAVRGFQRGGLREREAVLATAKHFLADGGTAFGSSTPPLMLIDQGDARIAESELRAIHLLPYRRAIAAGAASIMASYSSWNGTKMHANRYLLTELLKNELGFDGFVISDYLAIDQLNPDYKEAVRQAITAGIDMGMVAHRYRDFITALLALVREGAIGEDRIEDAVRRILRVKAAMGLLNATPALWSNAELQEYVGSAEHRALARRAVRESVVLLKNERSLLPLSKSARRIHVAGVHADNLGYQCGGWTIAWRGGSGRITEGTTILEGIRAIVSPATEVTYSLDGSGAAGADVAIVAIGERPYAEYTGDRADLALEPRQVELVRTVAQAGAPVVVVLVTGRPLILGEVLSLADALLVVWLPGTEGQGVADVLFGDFAPVGKLSFSWPRSIEQIPINVGDAVYDPLFPFGYGLVYSR